MQTSVPWQSNPTGSRVYGCISAGSFEWEKKKKKLWSAKGAVYKWVSLILSPVLVGECCFNLLVEIRGVNCRYQRAVPLCLQSQHGLHADPRSELSLELLSCDCSHHDLLIFSQETS